MICLDLVVRGWVPEPAPPVRMRGMYEDDTIRAPATSFIVRIWNDKGQARGMRGEVEHLRTGEKRLFVDYWTLLDILEAWRLDAETVVSPV